MLRSMVLERRPQLALHGSLSRCHWAEVWGFRGRKIGLRCFQKSIFSGKNTETTDAFVAGVSFFLCMFEDIFESLTHMVYEIV